MDKNGRVVASLGGDNLGGNLLVFNSQNTQDPVVFVSPSANGGGLISLYEKMAPGPKPARAADMTVTAGLEVYNASENDVARVVAERGGGGSLAIFNKKGREAAQIRTNEDGGFFSLINSLGATQVGARCTRSGGAIAVYNPDSNITAALRSVKEGGEVEVLYPNGTVAALLHVQATGGDIGVTNRSGRAVAQLGVNLSGDADLFLNNHEGKKIGWLTTLANSRSGGFQLFEPDSGKVVFHAP